MLHSTSLIFCFTLITLLILQKIYCLNFVMLYCCSNGAVWRFQVYMYCLCLSVCPSSMKSYAPCVKMASCFIIMGVQGLVCWYACKKNIWTCYILYKWKEVFICSLVYVNILHIRWCLLQWIFSLIIKNH